jgi:cytochrome c oxidase subunit II
MTRMHRARHDAVYRYASQFHRRLVPLTATALALAGCRGWQSAADPQGPQASQLTMLIWLFVIVAGVIWALVMLVLAAALWRRRRSEPREQRTAWFVGGAMVASVLVILGLTVASYVATRHISPDPTDPIVIRLKGYQWWWSATYVDAQPADSFITANELHVPVGRPVRVELEAEDVIHSFWVPNLAGKQDLIPGRSNSIVFTVDRPGTYRGQCAEFCGLQHAHMALLVVAESQDDFQRWRKAQLADAKTPATPEQSAGRDVFVAKACAACHTVRGTSAAGSLGPDLTHVGGRQYIAAGMLPTTRGSLAAWVADPQTIKPGNNMPLVPLEPRELNALSAWLASLQ